jgi:urease accessory protein
VLIVTAVHLHVDAAALAGKARDVLALTWEERRWTRRRVTTRGGRELALALPTGSVLRPGDVIAVEPGWYLAVEAAPEPVLAVAPRDRAEAIRVAFEVGNRHFALALDGGELLVPDDSAMVQLLDRLGVAWRRCRAVFDPVGAGHRHEAGASPLDGHRHAGRAPAGEHAGG